MCSEAGILFVARSLTPEMVRGKRIVEMGIGQVSAKPLLVSWSPAEYVGVDVHPTPYADRVIPPERVVESLGEESVDVVLATEVLEHARDWRLVVTSFKRICRPGGRIVLTTRSLGYRFHAPPDYWRYEVSDLEQIFADCRPLSVEPDPFEPGVFVAATRIAPTEAGFCDLSKIALHSMVYGQRSLEIPSGPLSRGATWYEMWKARVSETARMVVGTLRGQPPVVHFLPPPPVGDVKDGDPKEVRDSS